MDQKLSVPIEIKSLSAREFEGYGSIFGNVDLGNDIVMPGAFKRTIVEHKAAGTMPAMFWMHNPDQVPGVWLDIQEDDRGLYVKGELADTQLGNEMRTLMKMRAVRGMSIGYKNMSPGVYDRAGNRLLKDLDLPEVSLVSLAMNPLARVEGVKCRLSEHGLYVPTEREFEEFLLDPHGSPWKLSKKAARHIAARVYGRSGGMPDLADHEDDSDSGGTPDDQRRDAGESEEAKAVMDALTSLSDSTWSAVFRR